MQHEANRLGNRHKITCDLGMSYGHRAALLDLFEKQGNHAAIAAQHVAEANGRKNRSVHRAVPSQSLHINFADALGLDDFVLAGMSLGGLTALGLGITGEYLWLTLQNSRGRPNFIVRSTATFDRPRSDYVPVAGATSARKSS